MRLLLAAVDFTFYLTAINRWRSKPQTTGCLIFHNRLQLDEVQDFTPIACLLTAEQAKAKVGYEIGR